MLDAITHRHNSSQFLPDLTTQQHNRDNEIKVARMVNLKLIFGDYFFLNFGNTNQVMQNPILKLRHRSIISKKPGFLSEKLETLTSYNYHGV